MPRVSVVIPAYNYGRYVGQAVESVLAQTVTDLDVAVVDDGSTDDTPEVVARYAAADRRVRYLRGPNRGPAAARNAGIRATESDWVGFLDADDIWLPHKLERQLARARQQADVGLVSVGYSVWDETAGTETPRGIRPLRGDALAALAIENVVPGSASSALIRRSALDLVGGFDESLRACEDWDLFVRLARVTRFECVDEPLLRIRIHGPSNMAVERMETSLGRVIRKIYDDPTLPAEIRPLERSAWAAAYLTLGKLALRYGGRSRAVRYLLRAAVHRPTWADPYVVLARMLTGRRG